MGLVFIGMIGPDSHNPEEQRFVEELSVGFTNTYYLRGVGIKGLRPHQLKSIPSRLTTRRASATKPNLISGSVYIIPLRRLARGLNARWIRRRLAQLLRSAPADWTIWLRFPSPELVDAVAAMPGIRVVYEPIDQYSAAEDLTHAQSKALLEAETRLMRLATVVTGGQLLADRFKDAAGGSYWLPFGADRRVLVAGTGLPPKRTPRLAVVGCFDGRVDEALLTSLMSVHPEWQLILAGPRVRPWGKRLERLPNVEWLGRIPVERVGPVLRDCDVALIPYRLTDWTRHCLPVKVFEYLAEGKPVVATPLPELKLLGDAVSIAEASGFSRAIEAALDGDSPPAQERRRQAAAQFTLQDRARRAIQLIQGKELEVAAR